MKPSDALQQDWRMYYDGVWMKHPLHGVGMVSVVDGGLYLYPDPVGNPHNPLKVRATDLTCWWPRSGSYNMPGGAVYIARKSTRSMRKSAQPNEHYLVRWGGKNMRPLVMMMNLREGHSFVELSFAREALRTKVTNSIAISRDVILARNGDTTQIVFHGLSVGTTERGTFKPKFPKSHLSRRVTARLAELKVI